MHRSIFLFVLKIVYSIVLREIFWQSLKARLNFCSCMNWACHLSTWSITHRLLLSYNVSFMWVQKDKHAYKQTYKHTHTFWKKISGKQVCGGRLWAHTWLKKKHVKFRQFLRLTSHKRLAQMWCGDIGWHFHCKNRLVLWKCHGAMYMRKLQYCSSC